MDPRPPEQVFVLNGRTTQVRLPPLLARVIAVLILLAILVIGVVLVLPFLIIGTIVLAVGLGLFWIRRKLRAAKQPNGPLDGRRNVRVFNRGP